MVCSSMMVLFVADFSYSSDTVVEIWELIMLLVGEPGWKLQPRRKNNVREKE